MIIPELPTPEEPKLRLQAAPLYYLLLNNEQEGPYTLGQIKSMWNAGGITVKTLYCVEGKSEWKPLLDMTSILDSSGMDVKSNRNAFTQTSQNQSGNPSINQQLTLLGIQSKMKSKTVAVLLSIFFPFIGCLYSAPRAAIICGGMTVLFIGTSVELGGGSDPFWFILSFILYICSIFFSIKGVGRFNQCLIAQRIEK